MAALAVVLLTACSGEPSPSQPSGSQASTGSGPTATAGRPSAPAPTAGGAQETPPSSGTWQRVTVNGPAPKGREDHTWTVAEDGRTAYLFGGRDGGKVFDDLWAFDLGSSTWRRIAIEGAAPAARFGHEAVWLPSRGLVIFAGQSGGSFFNDLWLFDPATSRWQLQPAGGSVPVPRYGSCSGIGPDGLLWISHGFTEDGVRFADTKAYDFNAGVWHDEAPAGDGPIERCLHACWWTADGRFALFGGQTTGVPALGDLWFLTPGSGGPQTNHWEELRDPGPSARQLAAVAQLGPLTFLFGGRGSDRRPLRDMWVGANGVATRFAALEAQGQSPPARSGASLIADRPADRLLLFGGTGDHALADLWQLTFPAASP